MSFSTYACKPTNCKISFWNTRSRIPDPRSKYPIAIFLGPSTSDTHMRVVLWHACVYFITRMRVKILARIGVFLYVCVQRDKIEKSYWERPNNNSRSAVEIPNWKNTCMRLHSCGLFYIYATYIYARFFTSMRLHVCVFDLYMYSPGHACVYNYTHAREQILHVCAFCVVLSNTHACIWRSHMRVKYGA